MQYIPIYELIIKYNINIIDRMVIKNSTKSHKIPVTKK